MWVWACGCVNKVCMDVTGCGGGCVGVGVWVCLGMWMGGWVGFGQVA